MTSKTGVPEFVVGAVSSWIAIWLFPMVVNIQQFVLSDYYKSTIDTTGTMYQSILLSSASCVMFVGVFILTAVYCDAVVCEKVYYWAKTRGR